MSKLDDLIQKPCPDGVEFKSLGEVCEIKTGQSVSKRLISENLGEYPVINSGKEPLGFISIWNTEDDPIGITTRGAGVGSVTWQEGKYFRGNLNYAVTIKDKKFLNVRFLYHTLLYLEREIHALCVFSGIPALNASELKTLKIPIPPIEVQAEIVRILDTFTELTAELTAELTVRKKQYEFYRDLLLTFDDGVEFKKLGEIGKVSMCKRIMKYQTSADGEIPFYKIGTFGKTADAFISRKLFEQYRKNYSYPNKGDILISAAGTIGRTIIFDGEPAYFQDSNIVWVANDETKVLNKFLYYLYQKKIWQISNGGTIARLYNDDISNTKIPVPPIEEQEHIVKILDRFDKLCNDISEGLPAEISARQKQYEYYRDKLLTFDTQQNGRIGDNAIR